MAERKTKRRRLTLLDYALMAAVVLIFGAIARGQYRTDRPAVPLPTRHASHARPKAGTPPASVP